MESHCSDQRHSFESLRALSLLSKKASSQARWKMQRKILRQLRLTGAVETVFKISASDSRLRNSN
jgi:hypothetical protein